MTNTPASRRFGKLAAAAALILATLLLGGCEKPEIRFADGSAGKWADWNGRWVLINYWAEWCAPCREEIPELNRLHQEGESMDVVVLGVNFDGLLGEPLTALIERMGVAFPVLLDASGQVSTQYRVRGLPTTFFVDQDGVIQEKHIGPVDEAMLEDILLQVGVH